MEAGLTPDTVREDSPISYERLVAGELRSRHIAAPVTLRDALALSLNTVAAKLAMEVGPKAVVEDGPAHGHQFAAGANASIALGTSEVTPLEW